MPQPSPRRPGGERSRHGTRRGPPTTPFVSRTAALADDICEVVESLGARTLDGKTSEATFAELRRRAHELRSEVRAMSRRDLRDDDDEPRVAAATHALRELERVLEQTVRCFAESLRELTDEFARRGEHVADAEGVMVLAHACSRIAQTVLRSAPDGQARD